MTKLTVPELASCPFCEYLQGTGEAVFVSRGRVASVMVNPRQYERGALLVIPNGHATTLIDTDDEPFLAVQLEARRMARLLVEECGATGVNVFQNSGVSAGQTVPHYHVHVVPRYPSSDPARRFREADYSVAPLSELRAVADILNKPRQMLEAQHTPLPYEVYPQNRRLWLVLFAGWMLIALAALARLIAAPKDAMNWPATVPQGLQLAGLTAAMIALRAKGRRGLIAGYVISVGLFGLSIWVTF